MTKLYFFDKTKTYVYPNGEVATPERVARDFPASQLDGIKYVVSSDEAGIVMGGMDMLSTLRSVYSIDTTLSDDATLAKIEEIINTPPEPDNSPSAEERIAAALEYQVMSSLPDEE
jgi:hypothetical protein